MKRGSSFQQAGGYIAALACNFDVTSLLRAPKTAESQAELHPQGVCRIRKAAEPPTAAQQRVVEAEANRIAASNAAAPRYGQCNRQALQFFELLACNVGPFSWGSKGDILFPRKENIPLIRIPCTVQGTSICPLAKAIVAAILQKAPFGHNYRK